MHRRAAMAMKREREWAYVPQRTVECPACGEQLRAGAAICKHCNAVLDPDRAAKFFPHGPRDKASHVSGLSGPQNTGRLRKPNLG
jgi:hypothetical protein